MMVSCLMCGAGAVGGVMDGWHAIGPQAGLGGATCGDMELLEYHYPLLVHTLRPDARTREGRASGAAAAGSVTTSSASGTR